MCTLSDRTLVLEAIRRNRSTKREGLHCTPGNLQNALNFWTKNKHRCEVICELVEDKTLTVEVSRHTRRRQPDGTYPNIERAVGTIPCFHPNAGEEIGSLIQICTTVEGEHIRLHKPLPRSLKSYYYFNWISVFITADGLPSDFESTSVAVW